MTYLKGSCLTSGMKTDEAGQGYRQTEVSQAVWRRRWERPWLGLDCRESESEGLLLF